MGVSILEQLEREDLLALRFRGSDWPRGVFSQTLIPDKWMGLLTKADGRRRFAPAGGDPRPDADDTLMLVRNRPLTVPVVVESAPTSDAHEVHATIELLVRCPARDDELAAFQNTLLERSELTHDQLARAVNKQGVANVLRQYIREHAAEVLVQSDQRNAIIELLRTELKQFLFSAGLELEGLGRCAFESDSFARHAALERQTARRVQELEARNVVEAAAREATHRRLDDLNDILGKLKSAANADGSLQWHELLPSLTPGERNRILENLWRLTPNRTIAREIVVVAGRACAWFGVGAAGGSTRQIQLPDDLGGLRSIAYDQFGGTLLVGAALGVWRLTADGEVLAKYAVPDVELPRTGFNEVATSESRLFATHSQLGAWAWTLDDPTAAECLLTVSDGQPRTVRAVTLDEQGRVLIAVDDRVRAFGTDGELLWESPPADGTIHCISPLEQLLYVGTEGGALQRCALDLPQAWTHVHRAHAAIESIVARRWDDLVELVIPSGREGVLGVYGSEGSVSRLMQAPTSIRRVWASDDALVALAGGRDRLFVQRATQTEQEVREVPAARLLGRSVQDVCLVTSRDDENA